MPPRGTSWAKSTRKFLSEYRRSRLGLAGVAIILYFVLVAAFAPYLTHHDPIYDQNLASPLSVPEWTRAFPQYANLPVNALLLKGASLTSSSDLTYWKIANTSTNVGGNASSTYNTSTTGLLVRFETKNATSIFRLSQTLHYDWSAPCRFIASISLTPRDLNLSTTDLTFDIYITSGKNTYHILDPSVYANPGDASEYFSDFTTGQTYTVSADSKNVYVNLLATGSTVPTNLGGCGLPNAIFNGPRNITISYIIKSIVPTSVLISNPNLYIVGSAYGILGTDDLGRDVWSQFVYGSRVSLEVGLLAAVVAVVIGTVVGLVAGYVGRVWDELLMRFTDFMLTLPFLPLVLIILTIIQVSRITLAISTEFIIVILIAVFSWQGIARIIRAQVLTVKHRQFVEASKSLGAGNGYIIRKHILPNVMGLVYANMALTVPGAILTEAALTFLGFGDPSIVSWGTVVANATSSITSLHAFVWWWFLPPGLAIALLSMAFVLVGFSLDAILNPRLRKR